MNPQHLCYTLILHPSMPDITTLRVTAETAHMFRTAVDLAHRGEYGHLLDETEVAMRRHALALMETVPPELKPAFEVWRDYFARHAPVPIADPLPPDAVIPEA